MLYLDDKLPRHPKLFKAGARLGDNGAAQVLAVYVAGLGYAREHLTDGFVPAGFVNSLVVLVQTPQDVINAMVSRGVGLWHRVPGGYRIHDYHDWNDNAASIKEKREKWRAKKAAQRRRDSGEFANVSPGDMAGELRRDSRAPVPRSKYVQGHDREGRAISTDSVLTAPRSLRLLKTLPTPTHRMLCAMARAEREHAGDYGAWAEAVKRRLAGQGFGYPTPHAITAALEAVAHATGTEDEWLAQKTR